MRLLLTRWTCRLAAVSVAIGPTPLVLGAGNVVISQFYASGGNNGSNYKNDFVELFNRSGEPVSLNGWSLQYASAAGTTWNSKVTLPAITLQPGQFFLIGLGSGGADGTLDLPATDASTAAFNIAVDGGKLLLANTNTTQAGMCPAGAVKVDLVGYGTGNCFEGTAGAPANASATTATFRLNVSDGCVDANQNADDFSAGANKTAAPRNSASPAVRCGAACCGVNSTCTFVTAAECQAASGIYRPGRLCSQNDCASQACCYNDGSCEVTAVGQCNGVDHPPGSVCAPMLCPVLVGACCNANGTCTQTLPIDCLRGDVFVGVGTPCQPNPCTGACCSPDGTCVAADSANVCDGIFLGVVTTCTPNPCPLPGMGACCRVDSCELQSPVVCALLGGDYRGDGAACIPDPCPGACCHPNNTCDVRTGPGCRAAGGTFQGEGIPCDGDPCPGACCKCNHCVVVASPAACVEGTFMSAETCLVDTCMPFGACCVNGDCSILTQPLCQLPAGTYGGDCSVCTPVTCTPGACCIPGPSCISVIEFDCRDQGGDFRGGGVLCMSDPCPGACCFPNGTCTEVLGSGLCTGTFLEARICMPDPCPGVCCIGSTCKNTVTKVVCLTLMQPFSAWTTATGNTCNAPGNRTLPCCAADFNHTGGISVQDLFDFLANWFTQSPICDIDDSGSTTLPDLLEFLRAWFQRGCP